MRTALLFPLIVAALAAPAHSDQPLAGNAPIPRPVVDSATGIIIFDRVNPVTTPGTITTWRFYTAPGGGAASVELLVFRPAAAGWTYLGSDPVSSVAWNALNERTLATPIAVQPGDLIGIYYPVDTTPCVAFTTGLGASFNNHNWPWDPIPPTHHDIPNLFTTQWYGPWDTNQRTYSFQASGTPACAADIGMTGGIPGADGILDNNDFVVFIDFFFAHNPIADAGSTGGLSGADGAWDNNDFVVFIDRFFAGCG